MRGCTQPEIDTKMSQEVDAVPQTCPQCMLAISVLSCGSCLNHADPSR